MFLALLIIFGSLSLIVGIGALTVIQSDDLLLFIIATPISALFITFISSLYFRNKTVIARKIQTVCEIVFAITIVNFILFLIVNFIVGGSALNGKVSEGHYYVGNFGFYKEVPYALYVYSLIHTYSLFITHPLLLIASWIHIMTGGKGRIKQLLNLSVLLHRRRNMVLDENSLPRSK